MNLAEAGEIFRYWEHNPPPHLMLQAIARMLGWSPPPAAAAPAIAALAAAPPPGLAIVRGGDIGVPTPPLLDPAALRVRNRDRALEIARRGTTLSPGGGEGAGAPAERQRLRTFAAAALSEVTLG